MHCVTVVYPYRADARFDFDYYRDRHVPLVRSLVGDVVQRVEVRRGLASAVGGEPAFTLTATFWLSSLAEFQQQMAKHAAQIFADAPNYTDLQPLLQIDEILT